MEKANANGVLLKILAVSSIFLKNPVSGIILTIESGITSTMECDTTSNRENVIECNTISIMECGTTPAMESGTTSSMKFDTTSAPTSTMKNALAIVWRSILKAKDNNATIFALIL